MRENRAGRYILYFVIDVKTKRFCLVVPECKGLLGGWAIFTEILRDLGVVTQEEVKFEEALRVKPKSKVMTIERKDEKCLGKKVEGEKKPFVDVSKESV